MKKLRTDQKVVLALGIVGVGVGIYGRFSGWEYDDYFVPFYTGISLSWIAFLQSDSKSCQNFGRLKRGFKKFVANLPKVFAR